MLSASRSAGGGLSDAAKQSELLAAVREKTMAVERTLEQAKGHPLMAPFGPALRRLSSLCSSLSPLLASLTSPTPAVMATCYGLLGACKLIHANLAPFAHGMSAAQHAAHARDNSALVRRKIDAMLRLYSLALHDLTQSTMWAARELRERPLMFHKIAPKGASAGMLSPSMANRSTSTSSFSHAIPTATLSSPLSFEEDYFGDPSSSPYAIEAAQSAQRKAAEDVALSYAAFPDPGITPNAGESAEKYRRDPSAARGKKAQRSSMPLRPQLPLCADFFSPAALANSPLPLPADHIPSLRHRELLSLRRAFARLNVSYTAGSNAGSNPLGPRVVFIQGDPGLGGQEYARTLLHELMRFVPAAEPSLASASAASAAAAAQSDFPSGMTSPAAASSSSSPAPSYPPTSAASYTSSYRPLAFQFTRHAQFIYRRRAESVLDGLARRLKGVTAPSTQGEVHHDEEGAARIIEPAAPEGSVSGSGGSSHRGSLSASSSASGAGGGASAASKSSIARLEKEKTHSMQRLRVDSGAVMKSLLSSLALSASSGEGELYVSDADLTARWRRHVLDAHNVVLLSNVHLGDSDEIIRLLHPATAASDPARRNKAVFIIQSRQALKAAQRACASTCVVQQLMHMDDSQSAHLVLKLSERRAVLRARINAGGAASVPRAPTSNRLVSQVDPGHALRLGTLSRGSPFVARLLVRNLEAGKPIPRAPQRTDSAASVQALQLEAQSHPRSSRATAQWMCTQLESKPPALDKWLLEHFFPSSQKPTVAPAISFVFRLLSEGARELFVSICYALSGASTFNMRTLRAALPKWGLDRLGVDRVGLGGGDHEPHSRDAVLAQHLGELVARGMVDTIGELVDHGGEGRVDEPAEEEDDPALAQRGQLPPVAETEGAGESDDPLDVVHTPPALGSSLSLARARFRVHDLLKEFGLALAHAGPNLPGGSDVAKHLGASFAAHWSIPSSADRHRRGLHLSLVAHVAHVVLDWNTRYEAWWQGRRADDGEPVDPDSEDEPDSDEDDFPAAGLASASSMERRRADTLFGLPPAEREEVLRKRAELKVTLTARLVAEEELEQQAKDKARRSSRSIRGGDATMLGPNRRSTLLSLSRARHEASTLPASSFVSLPRAKPTELVFKTVKRLRSLLEDKEEDDDDSGDDEGKDESEEAKPVEQRKPDSLAPAAQEAAHPPALAAPVPSRAAARSPSPSASSSTSSDGDADGASDANGADDSISLSASSSVAPSPSRSPAPNAFDADNGVSDDEDGDDLGAIPVAEEDDPDPEEAVDMSSPILSPRAARAHALGFGIDDGEAKAQPNKLATLFIDLHAVWEEEQAEDGDEERISIMRDPSTSNLAQPVAAAPQLISSPTFDAGDFDDSSDSDASDSSDDEYDAVEHSKRASALQLANENPSEVAGLLLQMEEADRQSRAAIKAQRRLEAQQIAAEAERERVEATAFEALFENDIIDHGSAVRPSLYPTLAPSASLQSLGAAGTSSQPQLSVLASATMRSVLPARRAPQATVATPSAAGTGRARASTTFAADAMATPSFIRSVQLSRLMHSLDLDLTLILSALQCSYLASKHNLSAVLLFSPKAIFAARLSSDQSRRICFRFLEMCKPRFGAEWMRGLWHLGECYRAQGALQKARDCAEESRLIAIRQGSNGVQNLIASQVSVALIHQSQLCSGRLAKFGSWIENGRITVATVHSHESSVDADGNLTPLSQSQSNSMAYPQTPAFSNAGGNFSFVGGSMVSNASVLSSGAAAFSRDGSGIALLGSNTSLALHSSASSGDATHLDSVLDAIVECYDRALATLESNSMTLLSSMDLSSGLGPHALNAAVMFLCLRTGIFYALKFATQNALNMFRRIIEMKAAEVTFLRARRARARKLRRETVAAHNAAGAGSARPAFLQSHSTVSTSTLSAALFPFPLPSTTRLLAQALFACGLVYFAAADLKEALEFFERARRVCGQIMFRRWKREKLYRDASERSVAKLRSAATVTGEDESADEESAWIDSASFLSSIATPQQLSDLLIYIRCLYMLACTYERMGQIAAAAAEIAAFKAAAVGLVSASASPSAAASPASPSAFLSRASASPAVAASPSGAASSSSSPAVATASSSFAYLALVLRSRVISVWRRVTEDHKLAAMHDAQWSLTAGLSTLEAQ